MLGIEIDNKGNSRKFFIFAVLMAIIVFAIGIFLYTSYKLYQKKKELNSERMRLNTLIREERDTKRQISFRKRKLQELKRELQLTRNKLKLFPHFDSPEKVAKEITKICVKRHIVLTKLVISEESQEFNKSKKKAPAKSVKTIYVSFVLLGKEDSIIDALQDIFRSMPLVAVNFSIKKQQFLSVTLSGEVPYI